MAASDVGEAGDAFVQPERRRDDSMHADPRLVGDRARKRRALEADQIDIDAVGRERMRVVLHAGASSQISERDDGGSHVAGIVSRNW